MPYNTVDRTGGSGKEEVLHEQARIRQPARDVAPRLLMGPGANDTTPGAAGSFAPSWSLNQGFHVPAAPGPVNFMITGFVPRLTVSAVSHALLEFRNFLM